MKRGATKQEIILATQELIARNGIRAVRVDEIAQRLGISKRTLYELFADKHDLVNACLEAMGQQQQQRILACRRRRSGNSLQQTAKLAAEYIDSLFSVESFFLADIRHRVAYADNFAEHRHFWYKEFAQCMESCRAEHFLMPELDAVKFASRVLETLFELRVTGGATREELYLFCRTLLRGAATQEGIEQIDSK